MLHLTFLAGNFLRTISIIVLFLLTEAGFSMVMALLLTMLRSFFRFILLLMALYLKAVFLLKIQIFSSQTDKNWASSLLHNGTPGKENSLLGTCDWKISLLLDKEIWEINP